LTGTSLVGSARFSETVLGGTLPEKGSISEDSRVYLGGSCVDQKSVQLGRRDLVRHVVIFGLGRWT
jgi:hypothetical protein